MNLSNRYLKAWLSFNTSPTEDVKLNQWTTYGNPTIGTQNAFNNNALQLDGQSYIKLSGIELGGKDFYIDGWVYVDSSSPNNARVVHIVNSSGFALVTVRKNSNDATKLDFWTNSYADVSQDYGYTYVSSINSVGTRVHFKLIYRYSDKRLSFCINDKIAADWTSQVPQYNRQTVDIYIGALPNGNQGLIGTVDELRIYDGTWFAYNYGTPPTLADYQEITFTTDVKQKIKNKPLEWRYENAGTADTLIIAGTTLTDLPESKSKTGTAFYQTTRAKCFDLPATSEVWIKFDIFFDGSNRWRAFNGGDNSNPYNAGVTAQNGSWIGTLSLVQNSAVIQNTAGICKTNQLQTVLLHMVSGSSAGVIEAWVDGTLIYRYTGDVNHGEDFADIYLQSDGAGTFFSNVIISNTEIDLGEGYQIFTVDVVCVVKNYSKLFECLVTWLPFDESTTQDLCGNTWTASGTPTIEDANAISGKALQLSGGSYVMCTDVTIGMQDFTICGWCYTNSSSGNWARVFEMLTTDANSANILYLAKNGSNFVLSARGASDSETQNSFTGTFNQRIHFAVVYQHEAATVKCYINGQLSATITNKIMARVSRRLRLGKSSWSGDGTFIGTLDEFQIYDGVALYTENFTPPTIDDYISLSFELNGIVTFICDISIQINANLILDFDLSRKLENNSFNVLPFLKSWLPFDTYTTLDVCDNTWSSVGTLAISDDNAFLNNSLQLDGSSYLKLNNSIQLGGQDFTIDCWCYFTKTGGYSRIFEMKTTNGIIGIDFPNNQIRLNWLGTENSFNYSVRNKLIHVALVYIHNKGLVTLYVDGVEIGFKIQAMSRFTISVFYIGEYTNGGNYYFKGSIDEFRIFDNIALWQNDFVPPNKDKYVELLESMLISRHVKFEFIYDVSRYIDSLYSMFFDVKLQFVNASYYPGIYQDNPTAGTNDGTAVSSGDDYSSPISVNLDASKSESKIVKLSIRATSQSSDTSISIFDNRNHLKLSKNAEGPFSDSLTFDSLNGDNQIFYVQANSSVEELPSFENDTKLITNSRIVYNMKSLLTFDDSTINDQAGVVWQANNGSVNIINGELQFDGNFYLSTNNIMLGGNDFVIEGYFTISSSSGSNCPIFSLHNNMQTTNNRISFLYYNSARMYTVCMGQTSVSFDVTLDTNHYFIFKYSQDLGQITIFIDNELKLTWNKQIPKTIFNNLWLGRSNYSSDSMLKGTIGEFRIFEGSLFQQTSNISLDIVNPVATDNYSASNDVTVWLPFTHYPTEDYCGNSWKILPGQFVKIDLDPDENKPCVYIETQGSHYGPAMQLDCAGMYIGGKDFYVSFDLWYGGGMPFSDRSVFQFGLSKLGDIGVVVSERWSPNWQLTHLHVFGQDTPLRSLDYRQWWNVMVNYSHSTRQISFFIRDKDNNYTDTLNVDIPRTFFPLVGIQVPGMDAVANCFMRNFIIMGGETVPTCGSTIQLCVRHNNEVLTYPLRNYDFCSLPAFCVCYNGRSWYNILREVNDPLASNFYILHNDKMYALSK